MLPHLSPTKGLKNSINDMCKHGDFIIGIVLNNKRKSLSLLNETEIAHDQLHLTTSLISHRNVVM